MGLNATIYRDDAQDVEIASARLGNVAEISEIGRAIQEQVPSATTLLTKVLYSGSHSGDSLAAEDIRRLKTELALVARALATDRQVLDFASALGRIVEVALDQNRPITF